MQRSYSVVTSPVTGRFSTRYPALAGIPFILDSRPGYHRLGSNYLIERGLGIWSPSIRIGGIPRIPTEKSISNYAHWLSNFLEWADLRSIDLSTCSYSVHIIGRYQSEMLQGTWSTSGTPLMTSTVNSRVQQACDFISWMVDKGIRGPFEVPYETRKLTLGSATGARGQLQKEVRVRGGKVPRKPRCLHMPGSVSLRNWLKAVNDTAGEARGLMCETILLTAMRREEVACLRIDTLPRNPIDWHVVNPEAPEHNQSVRIEIKFGTKGPNFGRDHGDKVGPTRAILIPLSLAKRWHAYRSGARIKAFKRWMDGTPSHQTRAKRAEASVHLFLRENDGTRFKAKALYDAWRSVDLPVPGWCPHEGRHWWACSVLMRELRKQRHIFDLKGEATAAMLESTSISIIRMHIQPQLGHADDSTTMLYLTWALQQFSAPVCLDEELTLDITA